jgi:hypothetical protein
MAGRIWGGRQDQDVWANIELRRDRMTRKFVAEIPGGCMVAVRSILGTSGDI